MEGRRRGGRLAIFLLLALVFVIMLTVTLTHGSHPCQGLSCPSGGGAAQDANGVGRALDDIGTFLAGVAAFGSFILYLKGGGKKTPAAR